jgi:hypothetical protein
VTSSSGPYFTGPDHFSRRYRVERRGRENGKKQDAGDEASLYRQACFKRAANA